VKNAPKFTPEKTETERFVVGNTAGYTNLSILVGLLFLFGIGYFGCGIKGPPVPPRQAPVSAVAELTYQAADQTVTLEWRLTGPLSAKQSKKAAFGIYQSRTSLAETPCDGCPLVFEKVASVAYVDSDTHRFSIDIPLETGYRYVFKVRLETESGAGPDSNLVRLDHLSDRPPGTSETP
jgi:hypothetical protein